MDEVLFQSGSGYPGPFKCPDCGTWWAGFSHRCPPPTIKLTGTWVPSTTVVCTCPPNRGDNFAGTCPIHDAHTTYTFTSAVMPEPTTTNDIAYRPDSGTVN
jgi:hypothetical protein